MKIGKLARAMLMSIIIITMNYAVSATNHVVISEVLYDPAGTESGGEAVEIYNPTNDSIDISGWTIRTESSSADATIPDSTTLASGGYYLIADSGWSTMRDDLSWEEADHEEAITMYNTDSGIALVELNGTIIDAVGWGNSTGIPEELYELEPAAHVASGKSLVRIDVDSDDNINDFTESNVEFKNSTSETVEINNSEEVVLEVEVENTAPSVSSIAISDDDTLVEGFQVIPEAGGTRVVDVFVNVSDLDGVDNIEFVEIVFRNNTITMTQQNNLSNTTAKYTGTIDMDYYDAAGEYNVTVVAGDSVLNDSSGTSFQYYEMIAIELDSSGLQFPKASPGGVLELSGDTIMSTTDMPSVRNIGNVQVDVGIQGSDMTDGTNSIGVENIAYTFDNDFSGAMSGVLGLVMQTVVIGMETGADSVVPLGFRLNIPSSTPSGNYSGSVVVMAMGG